MAAWVHTVVFLALTDLRVLLLDRVRMLGLDFFFAPGVGRVRGLVEPSRFVRACEFGLL